MKSKLKLILPNKEFAGSYIKGEKEYVNEKNRVAASGAELLKTVKDFPVYKQRINWDRKGIKLKKNWVPSTLYWAVVGDKFVGRLSLRHKLNKHLRDVGGHIGYSVVPSQRRKGYATEMLRLSLKKAKQLGFKKVLVTCDEDNIPSRKVIEHNDGILENRFITPLGAPKLRFWIKIK